MASKSIVNHFKLKFKVRCATN